MPDDDPPGQGEHLDEIDDSESEELIDDEPVIIGGEEVGAEVPEEEPEAEPVYRRRFLSELKRHFNYSLFALGLMAIPIGILSAYGAMGFRKAFFLLDNILHTQSGLDTNIQKILILIAGALLIGWLLERMKWDRFRTPAHVILAVNERGGKISFKDGILTAMADALSLGMGAPVGRYGPAIHFGAALASSIAQKCRLNSTSIKILLGCGVASAISAAFNAPIAGAIFAHEVILGHFRLRAFAPITLASVAAVAITRFHGVEYTALKIAEYPGFLDLLDYPMFLLLGIIAAGISLLYMHGIIGVGMLAQKSKIPVKFQPAIGASCAGILALFIPSILGLGDDTIQEILSQSSTQITIGFLLALALCKLLASVACLGLRMPGGSFSPAILVGSCVGGIFGLVVPGVDYQIAVLVGMGAMVSSVMGAPLATILIVFELTENYQAATAVMVGVVAANAIVTRYFARSLFHRQIRFWGFDLSRSDEQRIMQSQKVGDIMGTSHLEVRPNRTVEELRKLVDRGYRSEVFVIDDERKLLGQLPLSVLATADPEATAEEVCDEPSLWLNESDSVWNGFETLKEFEGISIPVVEDDESMTLVGAVYTSDFLKLYKQAIDKSREDV